jgi:hypothetical protein
MTRLKRSRKIANHFIATVFIRSHRFHSLRRSGVQALLFDSIISTTWSYMNKDTRIFARQRTLSYTLHIPMKDGRGKGITAMVDPSWILRQVTGGSIDHAWTRTLLFRDLSSSRPMPKCVVRTIAPQNGPQIRFVASSGDDGEYKQEPKYNVTTKYASRLCLGTICLEHKSHHLVNVCVRRMRQDSCFRILCLSACFCSDPPRGAPPTTTLSSRISFLLKDWRFLQLTAFQGLRFKTQRSVLPVQQQRRQRHECPNLHCFGRLPGDGLRQQPKTISTH